jgi:hydroxymethylpyrimidine/phosphomethylpyrimidine kinase
VIQASNKSDPDQAPDLIPDPGRPTGGKQPIALAIAGFDPSSGAGITADLKVFAAYGLYGLAAITALTVQSTQGVRRMEAAPPEILRETLDCLAGDMEISGIKIGMLATEGAVETVVSFLAESGIPAADIVLDPVLMSSSGHPLLSSGGLNRLKTDLLPLVGWVTPNTEELAALTETPVPAREAVPEAAARLAAKYPRLNIVVTGGHLDPPDDFLRTADGKAQWFPGHRVPTKATHGTGCAFSSALLARLLVGDPPGDAVAAAKTYLTEAMQAAKPIGRGPGPLHHLYKYTPG